MMHFFTRTRDIIKSSYIWNSCAGLLNASQSVILLVVISRTNSINDAGIFSIAYAIASLALMLGTFNMRSFQATDIKRKYNFGDYLSSRVCSCCLMFLFCLGYCIYGVLCLGYSRNKTIVIMIVCLWKMVEALEDVFHGNIQQNDRLDIAAKAMAFRIALGLVAFIISLVLTNNLMVSATVCLCVSIVILVVVTFSLEREFNPISFGFQIKKIQNIFVSTLPLCAGGFLTMYIGNAPKYAIDACLNEEAQACFNYIFMPVFFTGLLASFIFNPILTDMAEAKSENDYAAFMSYVKKIIVIISVISMLIIIVGTLIGIPILSYLFNINLSSLRFELLVLLVGGSFYAIVSFFTVVMTIIRKQNRLLIGFVISAIVARCFSTFFVSRYYLFGAALVYSAVMACLAIIFVVIVVVEIKKAFMVGREE